MVRLKQRLVCLLITGLFSASTLAQFKLDQPIPVDRDVKIGKLSNGLTYYIRKNKKPENKVELRLVVNAGSVLENDNQQGLAHFMEHMGFNGSKNFPKNELVSFLQKAGVKFGADLNAYTSFDETVYILPLPTEDPVVVEKGFTILEDWAFNNLLDKKEIEKERGVVLEESRLRKGAFERMGRLYFPRLFNGSKYATRLPIGKDEVLKTFKPQTLEQFYRNWYRPNLMAVVVVGDMDVEDAEKKIRDHFEKYKNPPAAPNRPLIIPIKDRTIAEAMVLTDDEADNTSVQIFNFVKPAPALKTWNDYRSDLIESLISTLINQRLNELTQKENPPFLYANTGYTPFFRGYNSFNSYAILGKASVNEAVTALIEETSRAKQFGFLSAELERAKSTVLNEAEEDVKEKGKSESGLLVYDYVDHFLNDSPIPGVDDYLDFLKAVLPAIKIEEVNALAKKMPSIDKAFTLVQAPSEKKKELPSNAALLSVMTAAAKKQVKAYEEKAIAASLIDKLPVAGKITTESKNEKLGTFNYTLNNGVTITIRPTTFKNDEIQLDAWRWGGFRTVPVEDKNNATIVSFLVQQMGVKDMSGIELRKFMAGKTVDVMPYMNADEEGISGSSSVKDFETFLQLIHLYFTQPRKDEKMFNALLNSQKAALQFMKKNPETSFQDTLQKILYNNHPWLQGIPTPEDFEKLNLDRMMEIYNNVFGNAHGMHFTFVGNLDPEIAKPLLEQYLGSLPAKPKENKYKDVGIRLVKGVTEILLKRGKEQKAQINLYFQSEADYKRENRLKLRALIDVLNIQVTEKLREEMGGIYGGGFNGGFYRRPFEHYSVTATIPCGPENVEKLTAALLTLIKDAQEKGVDQKNLDKVKENWKKQHQVDLQSNQYWLDFLSEAFINENNPENILDYTKRIDALNVKDVQEAAKRFLTLDNFAKAVRMPENSPLKEEVKMNKKGF